MQLWISFYSLDHIIMVTWLLPILVLFNQVYSYFIQYYMYYLVQYYLIITTCYSLISYFYIGTQLPTAESKFYWSPLSLILVLCTEILVLVCFIIIEFRVDSRIQLLHFCIFLIQALSITFFSTQNLFTFYVLFELILVPFFLIIIGWGSAGKNIKAALYFFFYTYVASLPMLFSIIYIYLEKQDLIIFHLHELNFDNLTNRYIWLSFFLAFAAKLAIPPLHLWLVEAHVEAPTVGSVLLSGIALKIGLYGYLTILPTILSNVHYQMQQLLYPVLVLLFIYIVFIFFVQVDLKKIIAYLSIIHMVFILLGICSNTEVGVQGGVFMAITHSFVSPALFCCVGFIYDRYENRNVLNLRNLAQHMPILAIFMFFLILVEIGFPLTVNFIGEFLILKGIFDCIAYSIFLLCPAYVLLAATVFTAFAKMFFGPSNNELAYYSDLSYQEICVLSILTLPLIIFYMLPQLILDLADSLHYISAPLIF
jgi:NADH-quinone oxidoreductase subunit M